jgi:hypothetical protein
MAGKFWFDGAAPRHRADDLFLAKRPHDPARRQPVQRQQGAVRRPPTRRRRRGPDPLRQNITTFALQGTCLAVYDDGSGSKLYLGTNELSPTAHVLRWNGSSWDVVGTVTEPTNPAGDPNVRVTSMTVYDSDGPGPNRPVLVVGGSFRAVDGASGFSLLANYDGMNWSTNPGLFGPTTFWVDAAYAADIGSGPRLYVSGSFTSTFPRNVTDLAQWDGQQWSPMGPNPPLAPSVNVFAAVTDESGTTLWAGGGFGSIGGIAVKSLAVWNGISWSNPSGGVYRNPTGTQPGVVNAIRVFDDGRGPAIFVGGLFARVGPGGFVAANGVAR